MKSKIGLAVLVLLFIFGGTKAQGPSSYTKIGSVAAPTLAYTDTTCADGTACQYAVTAVNAAGESTSSNVSNAAVIPATGSWKVNLVWVAPTSGGAPTSYNIYQTVVTKPGPPSGCNATVVAGP